MQTTMVQISTVVSISASLLLFKMFPRVSCSNELTNCMYAVNAACEIISSNNRDCKVTCETPQQIGKLLMWYFYRPQTTFGAR